MRGVARSIELKVDEHDEITELELDDQSLEDDIEEARGPGKLTIPLDDPIRAGSSKRLVLRTRRSLAKSGASRISFAGFPLPIGARAIRVYRNHRAVRTFMSERRRRKACTGSMQANCRPSCGRGQSTYLAYEFPDQPFTLELMVEPSFPQLRGETRTFFQVESNEARSETTVDVSWVRGDLFELELAVVARHCRSIAVGPPDSVESTNLTEPSARSSMSRKGGGPGRRLSIRLTPRARDQGKVTLKLTAIEPINTPGSVKLGVVSRSIEQRLPGRSWRLRSVAVLRLIWKTRAEVATCARDPVSVPEPGCGLA